MNVKMNLNICPKQPNWEFFVNFISLIEVHLLEGPDLGFSMIYYDEKLEKKR